MWLICTFPSKNYDINDYPAVRDYLLSFGIERLEQTGRTHFVNGEKVKARKKTNNKWFETQDSISYWDDFSKQKIVYSETNDVNRTKIFLDQNGFFTDKTCFILISDIVSLNHIYKVMSSNIFTWYMKKSSSLLNDKGISLTKDTVEIFPLAPLSNNTPENDYKLSDEEIRYIEQDLLIN